MTPPPPKRVRAVCLGLTALAACSARALSAAPDAAPEVMTPADAGPQPDASLSSALDSGAPSLPEADAGPDVQTFALYVSSVDTTFVTEDHFIASVEMQLSGEPFAQAMGRDLGGYSRTYFCSTRVCQASLYTDPEGDGGSVVDLPGFSSAVESYEYSKQPMNNIAFESGAGTSLLFGSVLNPGGATGPLALQLAQGWISHMASEANTTSRFIKSLDPVSNPLGWPGLWPALQPFSQWNPAIQPTNVAGCSITSDDNPGNANALLSDDYECDYNTLHLPDRAAQVSPTIGPGSSGWVDWKEALWTLNYLQIMHDDHENPITSVTPGQLGEVGMPGNVVSGGTLYPGTYLGSSDIEGFQAGNFIQILDNQAAQWLLELTTTDGVTLGGFASLDDALSYSPSSPLRWFPSQIDVTEAPDDSGFPVPSSYTIASPDSSLLDLAGLLGAYSSVYSLTDQGNAQVGGSQPVMAYFDGDPFPVQNQVPDGEPTLHDRALAMMRVLVVDMDRMHIDPTSGIFVDQATFSAGAMTPSSTLSADVAAYTLLALRTARRALDSELALYTNTTPDAEGIPSPLDSFPTVDGQTFASRLDQLIDALSDVFYDVLTSADGTAFGGWDVVGSVATDDGTNLDAHTAAVRGLLVAYLATGNVQFRDRALSVFDRIESAFYDPSARIYRPTVGDRSLQVTFTPRRFGLLQGMLRDTYELIGAQPGHEALGSLIQDRVARLNKLVLNGWDDRDEDGLVEWPNECAHLGVGPDGRPLGLGALQMAERTLSGETGSMPDAPDGGRVIATDREHDCVPEISTVGLPSALANSVTFTLVAWSASDEGLVLQDGGWTDVLPGASPNAVEDGADGGAADAQPDTGQGTPEAEASEDAPPNSWSDDDGALADGGVAP